MEGDKKDAKSNSSFFYELRQRRENQAQAKENERKGGENKRAKSSRNPIGRNLNE